MVPIGEDKIGTIQVGTNVKLYEQQQKVESTYM